MSWIHVRIILGIIFIVGIFSLLIILTLLANFKKKFILYSKQIEKYGLIKNQTNFIKTHFDIIIVAYIFADIPSKKQNPSLYEKKQMVDLKHNIEILTKLAVPISIIMGLLIPTLIVLLNVFE